MSLFTLEMLIEKISTWLTTGEIDPAIFADEFRFISPYSDDQKDIGSPF